MNPLYRALGISKQSFHQKLNRLYMLRSEQEQLFILIHQLREDHPTMGMRDMYFKLAPECMGRDAFERFCVENDLKSKQKKNFRRTTDSSGVLRFDNLIDELSIVRINQVWQSDITYFEVNGIFYYLTFIIDAYSRRIVGYKASKRLFTEHTTIPALTMATQLRRKQRLSIVGLILHSDGGGQYFDKGFIELTSKEGIINSMCEYAWENGKAERINGVIKNNYLKHRVIKSYEDLVSELDRSVYLYNSKKPHIELQRLTPMKFENNYICKGQQSNGDKSAMEIETQQQRAFSALRAEDNNPSGSNIAQKIVN